MAMGPSFLQHEELWQAIIHVVSCLLQEWKCGVEGVHACVFLWCSVGIS